MIHIQEAQASAPAILNLNFGDSLSANTLSMVHFFIYHGYLPYDLTDGDLVKLVYCADEYMMDSLKAFCEVLLCRRVKMELAIPMYFLAVTLYLVILIRHARKGIPKVI